MSWSGGKDSALALHQLMTEPRFRNYEIDGLVTTLTAGYERVSGHGLHVDLLRRQFQALRLTGHLAYISTQSSMPEYEAVMADAYEQERRGGVEAVVFGDIFLKGPKKAHLGALQRVDMTGVFPLWHQDSLVTVRRFIQLGFRAMVICVDTAYLDTGFLGREIDEDFLRDLPAGVDPAGENGEYHTFVFDGPSWAETVNCHVGDVVVRERQAFCDLSCDSGGDTEVDLASP